MAPFRSLAEASAEELLNGLMSPDLERQLIEELPDHLFAALREMDVPMKGVEVTRYEHSLQSATHALRDGRDEEYVVAALLHDIGDTLAPFTHGEMTAAVLRPFVNEKTVWIVKYHTVFQMYHYAHKIGGDRDARDKYRDHPWFDDCAEFCLKYDQNCFDPDFTSLPLDHFEPMVRRVFAEPRYVSWA